MPQNHNLPPRPPLLPEIKHQVRRQAHKRIPGFLIGTAVGVAALALFTTATWPALLVGGAVCGYFGQKIAPTLNSFFKHKAHHPKPPPGPHASEPAISQSQSLQKARAAAVEKMTAGNPLGVEEQPNYFTSMVKTQGHNPPPIPNSPQRS